MFAFRSAAETGVPLIDICVTVWKRVLTRGEGGGGGRRNPVLGAFTRISFKAPASLLCRYHYPILTEEEAEVQGGCGSCPSKRQRQGLLFE